MVLEDHRLPQVDLPAHHPGRRRLLRSGRRRSDWPATRRQLMREGTKTRSSQQISQALETLAATVTVGERSLGRRRPRCPAASLTEDFPRAVRSRGGRPAQSVVPGRRMGSLQDADEGRLEQQRTKPGFLANEMFNRVVYGSHPAGRVSADAGQPRRDHAARRWSQFHQHALRARPRGDRVRRRHHARRRAQARGVEARRLEEGAARRSPK